MLANARGHSAGDFDLAIQPKFTAENVKKSLPPFLYSSLSEYITQYMDGMMQLSNTQEGLKGSEAHHEELLGTKSCLT